MPFSNVRRWLQKKRWAARPYRLELSIVFAGLLAIHTILFSARYRAGLNFTPDVAGVFGDFIGGYFGSIFALAGIALLVMTFKHERISNEHEKFEGRYFELLKMHRDNVAEMELGKAKGKKVFVLMLREWQAVLAIARSVAGVASVRLTREQMLQAAYYGFFFGVGPSSSRTLRAFLGRLPSGFVSAFEEALRDRDNKESAKRAGNLSYTPFEGHQSRLGHYYRHLYQLSRFVAEQKISINKREYLRTVRAQLSTHEQALLLLNSLSPVGQDWWRKSLIDRYRMVQNIPRYFFDENSEVPLEGLFGTKYFEWQRAHQAKPVSFPALETHDGVED